MREMHCDFCGEETTSEELMVIPTKVFEIPEINYRNESWAWGACPACAVHYWANEMDELLNRAVANHGEPLRNVLDVIYAAVRIYQNGPMRPWRESDEGGP